LALIGNGAVVFPGAVRGQAEGQHQAGGAFTRAAKVGDQVRFEWIDTVEGLAMTTFQVLRKAAPNEDKK